MNELLNPMAIPCMLSARLEVKDVTVGTNSAVAKINTPIESMTAQ
jgi:hypothetical protein